MRLVAVLFILICSCGHDTTSNARLNKPEKTEETQATVKADHIAVVQITGMVCKMGCGGAIRKDLKQMKGISKVEVDYEEDREVQLVKVFYDKEQVNSTGIADRIEQVNKQQFQIVELKTERLK